MNRLSISRQCLKIFCRQAFSRPTSELRRFSSMSSTSRDEKNKRKIFFEFNNSANEFNSTDEPSQTDGGLAFTCLDNELVLSERTIDYPFNYRTALEQQWEISTDRSVPAEQWEELYEKISKETKSVFGSITMYVCLKLKHVNRGRSLFDYIEKSHCESMNSSLTTVTNYMELLASDFFMQPKLNQTKKQSPYENELIRLYETHVKQKKPLMVGSSVALSLIRGLCVTRLYHEAFTFLRFINDDHQSDAMIELILASVNDDNLAMAKKLLLNLKKSPSPDSAAAILSTTLNEMVQKMFRNLNEKNPQAPDFIEALCQYLSTLDSFIEKSAIDEMQTFLCKYSDKTFRHGTTTISPDGSCKDLPGIQLKSGDLSDEEFKTLENYLMNTAYAKNELYLTTTPAEFERFEKFLKSFQFSLIVDGLNILYGIDRFATDPIRSMKKTMNFLKTLRLQQKQMLFVGRKHILSRIPLPIQQDLNNVCRIFLVDNTSRDDWFTLYAAVKHRAYVLTSDILRKERGINTKMGPVKNVQINELLQKWLFRYQYLFIRQNDRAYFKQPMAYKLRAQLANNIWLIPYFSEKPVSLAQRPNQWFFFYEITNKIEPLTIVSKKS